MSTIVPIILLGLAIYGVAAYVRNVKKKQLEGEGKIVARKGSFWEDESLFTTNVTYGTLVDAISKIDFSEIKADVYPNCDGEKCIVFKSSHSWNASLSYAGEKNGKELYEFSFIRWQERNGVPYNPNSMNMLVTTIEKTFFSLDPTASVLTQRGRFKSKSR